MHCNELFKVSFPSPKGRGVAESRGEVLFNLKTTLNEDLPGETSAFLQGGHDIKYSDFYKI
jgi:hypothetical protein